MKDKSVLSTFFILLSGSFFFLLSACTRSTGTPTPETRTGRGYAFIWYVATDGDDSSSCSYADDPCQTIDAALEKATATEASLYDSYDDVYTVDHTIHIAAGTYHTTQPLRITNKVRLIGAGEVDTIIDAGGTRTGLFLGEDADVRGRDFTLQNAGGVAPGSCVNMRDSSTAIFENVTLRDCSPNGVSNYSTGGLTLDSVTVLRASADGVTSGGTMHIDASTLFNNGGYGISSSGDLTVSETRIVGNAWGGLQLSGSATLDGLTVNNNGSGELGAQAGLSLYAGRYSVTDSSFTNHPREGIHTIEAGVVLNVSNSTIAGNDYPGLVIDGGTTTLDGVTIQGNGMLFTESSIAGGIEVDQGALILENSHVVRNQHGGILVGESGSLTLHNSAIESNLRDYPGLWNNGTTNIENSSITGNADSGIDNRNEMTIINSTISNNAVTGIHSNFGQLTLEYVTIAENGYNGLNSFRGAEGVRSVSNVIIANNGNEDCEISSAPGITLYTTTGTNFDSDGTCPFGGSSTPDLLLGALTAVGTLPGSFATAIHPLLDGSPAIDAASGSCPARDQHGVARPIGAGCDSGASEHAFSVTMAEEISNEDTQPPTVNTQSLCLEGPGSPYLTVSAIDVGTIVELLGIGNVEGWLVVDNPVYSGVACWLPEDVLDLDPGLDLSTLPVIKAPLLPTATPTAAPTPPNAPSNLKESGRVCSANEFSITLTWADNAANEDGYRVYRDGQLVATLGANTSHYTDTLPDYLAHSYTVEAYNDAGSANSNTIQTDLCLF